MAMKQIRLGALGAAALLAIGAPGAWACGGRTAGAATLAADTTATPGDMSPGSAMKSRPVENGRMRSESVDGDAGQGAVATDPDQKRGSKIQRETDPSKNGRSQSEDVNGDSKNGQPRK